MTQDQRDAINVLNFSMLAVLVLMNIAWHYGWA